VLLRALAAFGAALVILAWGIERDGIAAPYLDPIAHMRTQDEAVQAACAIRMAHSGDWATPVFLGRLFLYKPPLLLWMSAFFIRLFGMGVLAVRLPALLLGAAGVAAVYLWCARAGTAAGGALAAGLLLLSPFWQMFSRVCLTDIPSSAFGVMALTAAASDPRLERRRTAIIFGAAAGASILAKSIAGVLPLAALALYALLSARESRPRFSALLTACLTAAVIALPWHLYQLLIHPRWFWAEYVQLQILGVGLRSQTNAAAARSPLFYVDRFLRMDPVLAVLSGAGLARALWEWSGMRKQPGALLSLSAAAVTAAAMCLFQARHLPYLVFLLPPLCVTAVLCGPRRLRTAPLAAAVLAVLCAAKVIAAGAVWSLRPASPAIAGAQAMQQYAGLHRNRELIAAQPDDEFYSATLPIPRVRYCFLDPAGSVVAAVPYYPTLGIVLDTAQFANRASLLPGYARVLGEWGLASTEPVGTVIVVRTAGEMAKVAQAAPDSDLYLPSEWAGLIPDFMRTYKVVNVSEGRVFLLRR
jgi:4-amino-4-deoxy-L-arabinose transferase-like glycosyltransferase